MGSAYWQGDLSIPIALLLPSASRAPRAVSSLLTPGLPALFPPSGRPFFQLHQGRFREALPSENFDFSY